MKKCKTYILPLILIFIVSTTTAQQPNHDWWNIKHNWDKVTHWTQYLTVSPAFFGPNALPVPEVNTGLVSQEFTCNLAGESHFGKGDITKNLFLKIVVPIRKIVNVGIYYVPVEFYKMDTITRDKRAARDFDPQGFGFGDIYFFTKVQIIKDKKNWPDIAFNYAFKTTSGTDLDNARYTDTPGYYFDLSVGKTFNAQRIFGMGGFYSWQLYDGQHRQNDAALLGIGHKIDINKLTLINTLRSYIGYFNNGDKPLVIKSELLYNRTKTDFYTSVQYGIHDFPFTSLSFGIRYHISL